MTNDEFDRKLTELGKVRRLLEQGNPNPQAWRDLAMQYAEIGAKANAARCASKARYYARLSKLPDAG